MTSCKAGLLVHTFGIIAAPRVGELRREDAATRAYLPRIWAACDRLSMTDPAIDGVGASLPGSFSPLPRGSGGAVFELLAAKKRPSAETYEVYAFVEHDVAGTSAALASNRGDDGLETWPRLWKEWTEATGPDAPAEDLLGQSLVFFALAARPTRDMAGQLEAVLATIGVSVWAETAFQGVDELLLWEGSDRAGRRVLVVLVPEDAEERFDQVAWLPLGRRLPALTRYLLHAAKLRYQNKVFWLRREQLQESMRLVDGKLEQLLSRYRKPWPARPGVTASLLEAQRDLSVTQADKTGLVTRISVLRQLRRTIDVAGGNLLALARSLGWDGGPEAGADLTMFGRDQHLATWLSEQVDHELAYAEPVSERAAEVHNLTTLRLEAASEEVQRRRARLDLLQTVLLGALVTGLSLISAFDISFPLPSRLDLPLLAVTVTLSISVPLLTVHWHEPYERSDWAAAAVTGAVLGWLVVAVVAGSQPWFPGLAVLAAALGAVGMVIGLRTAHQLARRRSSGTNGGRRA
jgi:hypothetical protein